MGNSIYHTQCQYSFRLDHLQGNRGSHALVAGHPLTGQLVVVVSRDLPPTQIHLRFTGKEKTSIRIQQGKSSRTIRGERNICRSVVNLRTMGNNGIPCGTYSFPFEIATSSALPSSMDCASGSNSCHVIYKLKVDVTPQNRQPIYGVVERCFTLAAARLPDTAIPVSVVPKSHRVESFGFDRGYIAIAARILDVHVGRGTNLQLFMACKNDASASIYRVEVSLEETIYWKAQNNSRNSKRTIIMAHDLDLPGIMRGKLQDKEDVRQVIRRRGSSQEVLEFLRDELQSQRNRASIPIPMRARDTFKGLLIEVRHMLKITTYTKARISNPTICIPMRIGFPPIPGQEHTPAASRSRNRATTSEAIAIPVPQQNLPRVTPPPYVSSQPTSAGQGIIQQSSIPNLPDMSIPIVEASIIPVDNHTIQAPRASAPSESLMVGGVAIFHEEEDPEANGTAPPMVDAVAFSSNTGPPSLETLSQEMLRSIDDYAILVHKLEMPDWRTFLSGITPQELGTIVSMVNRDSSQPQVVELLAKEALGGLFTCEYGKEAVKNAEQWVRPKMVECVLPLCVDVSTNYFVIQEALTDWEQTLTLAEFGRYLA